MCWCVTVTQLSCGARRVFRARVQRQSLRCRFVGFCRIVDSGRALADVGGTESTVGSDGEAILATDGFAADREGVDGV